MLNYSDLEVFTPIVDEYANLEYVFGGLAIVLLLAVMGVAVLFSPYRKSKLLWTTTILLAGLVVTFSCLGLSKMNDRSETTATNVENYTKLIERNDETVGKWIEENHNIGKLKSYEGLSYHFEPAFDPDRAAKIKTGEKIVTTTTGDFYKLNVSNSGDYILYGENGSAIKPIAKKG